MNNKFREYKLTKDSEEENKFYLYHDNIQIGDSYSSPDRVAEKIVKNAQHLDPYGQNIILITENQKKIKAERPGDTSYYGKRVSVDSSSEIELSGKQMNELEEKVIKILKGE